MLARAAVAVCARRFGDDRHARTAAAAAAVAGDANLDR